MVDKVTQISDYDRLNLNLVGLGEDSLPLVSNETVRGAA